MSRTNLEIADTRLRERLVQTTAAVKRAYWNLVSANANVEARKSALALAEELTRVNKAKVDVGQSPQLDLVSAQAESTAGQEALIIAETAVKQAEDVLRMLILDPQLIAPCGAFRWYRRRARPSGLWPSTSIKQ